ncbi:MAGUK p55 subfamily member 4-like [Pseudochaenichthys georgianus]|uniref:MAGUK p55 subfamily member 4-like n=1 Tax=Pseudochaenichthys georgianus TaxID=52239 RepID=UPI00146DF726|nr:MAGUK p55 subfamily member 4-like [Pseudochaenichthys georgianus]
MASGRAHDLMDALSSLMALTMFVLLTHKDVYECLQTFLSDSPAPALDYASGLSLQLLIDIRSLPGCSEEANELYRLLRQPHLQALLSAHDTVAQKDYEPVLPPMPDELPEEEEATRTVCLVKNKQPLVSYTTKVSSIRHVTPRKNLCFLEHITNCISGEILHIVGLNTYIKIFVT